MYEFIYFKNKTLPQTIVGIQQCSILVNMKKGIF